MSSWHYQGQCIGRVLHFLYHYVGFDCAEHATVGPDYVWWRGRTIASYAWSTCFGESDVPEFAFYGDNAELYEANQATRRETAIQDALPEPPEFKGRKPVDDDVLRAIDPNMVDDVNMRSQLMSGSSPEYFIAGRSLWCRFGRVLDLNTLAVGIIDQRMRYKPVGRALYYWHRNLRAWLRGPTDHEQQENAAWAQ